MKHATVDGDSTSGFAQQSLRVNHTGLRLLWSCLTGYFPILSEVSIPKHILKTPSKTYLSDFELIKLIKQ